MPEPQPPTTPPTPPSPPTPPQGDEESRFHAYLDRYVRGHESQSVPTGQGQQQQTGPSLEQAIEAVLTRRERASASSKKMTELEEFKTAAQKRMDELEVLVRKGKSGVFSIFNGSR